MAIDYELAERMAKYLNMALAHDKAAVSALVEHRVSCGKAMATHPTIQVMRVDDDIQQQAGYYVGLLGLLNGFVGSYDDGPRRGWGAVIADMDDAGQIERFRVLDNEEGGT